MRSEWGKVWTSVLLRSRDRKAGRAGVPEDGGRDCREWVAAGKHHRWLSPRSWREGGTRACEGPTHQ
jgi:hypothetical protein